MSDVHWGEMSEQSVIAVNFPARDLSKREKVREKGEKVEMKREKVTRSLD